MDNGNDSEDEWFEKPLSDMIVASEQNSRYGTPSDKKEKPRLQKDASREKSNDKRVR